MKASSGTMAVTEKKRYVWDEEDEVAPSGEWCVEEGPVADLEDVQERVTAMAQELAAKRDSVRRLRVELRTMREEAVARRRWVEQDWARKLEAAESQHAAKVNKQRSLVARLEADVSDLENKVSALGAASPRNEAALIEACRRELATQREKLVAAWSARERKELEADVEKKKPGIKKQIVKALEPEVHRMMKSNRNELQEFRAETERLVEERARELDESNSAAAAEARARVQAEAEAALARRREAEARMFAERREDAERELRAAWEKHKAGLEEARSGAEAARAQALGEHTRQLDEMRAWEAERRGELQAEHRARLDRDGQEVEEADRRSSEAAESAAAEFRGKVMDEFARRRADDVQALVVPLRDKYRADVVVVCKKLDEDAEIDRGKFSADLDRRLRTFENQQTDAIAALKTQEVAAMELYLRTADEVAALKETIREEEVANADADADVARLRAQLDGLESSQARCDDELEATKRRVDQDHKMQAAVFEGKVLAADELFSELAARLDVESDRAEQDFAVVTVRHATQFDEIHAKIEAKLAAKRRKRKALLDDLGKVRASNATLEADINAKRLARLTMA